MGRAARLPQAQSRDAAADAHLARFARRQRPQVGRARIDDADLGVEHRRPDRARPDRNRADERRPNARAGDPRGATVAPRGRTAPSAEAGGGRYVGQRRLVRIEEVEVTWPGSDDRKSLSPGEPVTVAEGGSLTVTNEGTAAHDLTVEEGRDAARMPRSLHFGLQRERLPHVGPLDTVSGWSEGGGALVRMIPVAGGLPPVGLGRPARRHWCTCG